MWEGRWSRLLDARSSSTGMEVEDPGLFSEWAKANMGRGGRGRVAPVSAILWEPARGWKGRDLGQGQGLLGFCSH